MASTSHILMIRPAAFGFNEQTAGSNAFQSKNYQNEQVQQKALQEFDAMVRVLRSHGVDVIVLDDTEEPVKPDAVFPNNWVSFHENGDVLLYPMQAENRRMERREDVIRKLEDRFKVKHILDLSRFELQNKYLEGTGSMVLDHENKVVYACLSPRTNGDVLQEFCLYTGYQPVLFTATDDQQQAIYHTNVLMCIGSTYAVICLEAINDDTECQRVTDSLNKTGKEVVTITLEQVKHFAGNMLEVCSREGNCLLVMSEQAYRALTDEQIEAISKHAELIYTPLNTIETSGGGSARCMMAEVYLPDLGNAEI